eukprot:CAMPEP_0206011440 /NCGR_PEP_ID=MMETSP1464-20131121/13222_1 /ASSEMBLY_ACC=CAM_ASM_001124 /TAXON_ID=119497 /ORGANISM="Exanthemachrysis gayraliae, Strain RCC1523" /LENGTH=433 /DNA_ID=CAMNT_0053385103 /DNA_START=9 /DNA_END=1310 /DNA_ORIENTATION=+
MDDEDYGFEYSDEDPEEDDVNIENQYYNSKALLESDTDDALAGFREVLSMETDKGEWGFKALKQIVKLQFKLKIYDDMLKSYREMLTYIKSAVTRNYSEKVINKILDLVSASQDMALLQEFYQTTLGALKDANNDRLWFKTNLKLGKLYFDSGEYGHLQEIISELQKSCQSADGTDNQRKGTQLLEVYALEIQMYTKTKNNKQLAALYNQALQIQSAIPHPRIMGVIRECGGKMHMAQREWEKARTDFFEAFKNYDEAGEQRRIQCLKYLVLANMLMNSDINPFDSQEAKPYKSDPEIVAMTDLVQAYMQNEIRTFEKILVRNKRTIMDDDFIRDYIEDLLKMIRTQVLLKLIKPYTRIRIPFVAQHLNIPEADVECLLVSLILDGQIDGRIDQLEQLLTLSHNTQGAKKYQSMGKWASQLQGLHTSVFNKLS